MMQNFPISQTNYSQITIPDKIKKWLFSKKEWWFKVKNINWEQIYVWKEELELTKIDYLDFSVLTNSEIIELFNNHVWIDI